MCSGSEWHSARCGCSCLRPETLPRLDEITIDPVVIGFAAAASLLSGVLFGLIPIVKYSGPQFITALRGTRTASHSRERHRARNVLVVVQVALALVLLIASGLMIRTFQTLRQVQPGFSRPAELQMVRVSIPPTLIADPASGSNLQRHPREALDGAGSQRCGIHELRADRRLQQQRSGPRRGQGHRARQASAAPSFQVRLARLLSYCGHAVRRRTRHHLADVFDDRTVVVVSENMAREMWGEPAAALGKRIKAAPVDAWREIVGVVGDVYDNGVHQKAPTIVDWPTMMVKFWGNERFVSRSLTFVLRGDRA